MAPAARLATELKPQTHLAYAQCVAGSLVKYLHVDLMLMLYRQKILILKWLRVKDMCLILSRVLQGKSYMTFINSLQELTYFCFYCYLLSYRAESC